LNISTNNKGVGKTFIVFYAHKLFQEARRCIGMEVDNLYAHERALVKVYSVLLYPQGHICDDPHDLITCYDEHQNCILNCNSIEAATTLYQLLQKAPHNACVDAKNRKGIIMG
jgi:hypothetical protein